MVGGRMERPGPLGPWKQGHRMQQALGYLILAAIGAGLIAMLFRPHLALVLVLALFPLKQLMGTYLPVFLRVSPLFNFIVASGVGLAVLARLLRRERPLSGLGNGLTVVTLVLY